MNDLPDKLQVPYSRSKTFHGLLQILPEKGYSIQRCDVIAGDIVICKNATREIDASLVLRLTDGGHQTTIHSDLETKDLNVIMEALLTYLSAKK